MKTEAPAKKTVEDADLDGGVEKLSPEVKTLIEEAKKKGSVTYDELNKVLPDDTVSPEKLDAIFQMLDEMGIEIIEDRKSTRLNSSHSQTSYAVSCLKKKSTAPQSAFTR